MKYTALSIILLVSAWFVAAEQTARQSEVFMQVTEYCRLKQYAEAMRMAEKALQDVEKTHGEASTETQYYLDLLAQVCRIAGYWDRGQSLGPEVTRDGLYERSAAFYRRSAAILERQYGANHPAVAHPLFELGQLYGGKEWDWRKPEAAEGALKKALAIWERQEKPDEPQLLKTIKLLADVSEELGKNLEAAGYRDRIGIIKLGAGASKALDLEAKHQYLGALMELGAIMKCPRISFELFGAHQIYEDDGNVWVKRVMSRILKKMTIFPVLPEEAKRHIVKADEWLKKGDFYMAGSEYHKAIEIAPYIPQLYYNAALILEKQHQYDTAIDRMWMYLDLIPDAPDAEASKGKIRQWEIVLRQKRESDKEKKQ